VDRLAQVISDTGAPTRVEALIQQRVSEGVAALAEAPVTDQARSKLIELAVTATHRPA